MRRLYSFKPYISDSWVKPTILVIPKTSHTACLLIKTTTDELTEILADGPISHVKNSKVSVMGVIAKDEVDNEDAGGVFELNEWV